MARSPDVVPLQTTVSRADGEALNYAAAVYRRTAAEELRVSLRIAALVRTVYLARKRRLAAEADGDATAAEEQAAVERRYGSELGELTHEAYGGPVRAVSPLDLLAQSN